MSPRWSTWSTCSTGEVGGSRISSRWRSRGRACSTRSTPYLAWFSSPGSDKNRGRSMSQHDNLAIHEEDAQRINGVLLHFLGESGAMEALLIDRSGQLLARGGASRSLDTVSLSALAAGAFSSTAAMARLLGETEFTMLFHQGVKESIHVAAVDEHAILLAIFDSRTTVGMVRLFAKEAGTAIGAILAETRTRPHRTGALSTPLHKDEVQSSLRERSV